VDVLVNNAGIMPNGAFLEGTERIDRRMMDVNVHGVITGMRLVLPAMGGRACSFFIYLVDTPPPPRPPPPPRVSAWWRSGRVAASAAALSGASVAAAACVAC
uniref:SDR family NAD(P)-dependent oxidoreductase n=1 Tax=Nocardia cyriacigeorgica TaxID=135487 RepID=UPI002455F81E